VFSPNGRWIAVRADVAAGGGRIEADRGGRKGCSSLPSALRFAVGERFAPPRVASSHPSCAADCLEPERVAARSVANRSLTDSPFQSESQVLASVTEVK
jgi:hypothetical protein